MSDNNIESAVQNINRILEIQETEIKTLNTTVTEQKVQISALEQVIEGQKTTIRQQKVTITRLETLAGEQEDEIEALRVTTKHQDKRILELENSHKTQADKFDNKWKIMENTNALLRGKMLLGSVAFNFVDAAVQTMYGLERWWNDKVLKKLCTFKDINNYPKTETEQVKWKSFVDKYWSDELDIVFGTLKNARKRQGHPITLKEEDELKDDPPVVTSDELKQVTHALYISKQKKAIRTTINGLIDNLDTITHALGRDLLE
jgi:hypothetical protein